LNSSVPQREGAGRLSEVDAEVLRRDEGIFIVRSVTLKPPRGAEGCVGMSMSFDVAEDLCVGRSGILFSVFIE